MIKRYGLVGLVALSVCACSSSSDSGGSGSCNADGTYVYTLSNPQGSPACAQYPQLKSVSVQGSTIIATYADATGKQTTADCTVVFGGGRCLFDIECSILTYKDTFAIGSPPPMNPGDAILSRVSTSGTCSTLYNLTWTTN